MAESGGWRVLALLRAFRPTNLLALLVLAAIGYGGARYYLARQREARERQALADRLAKLQEENARLSSEARRLEARCAELEAFVGRLTTDTRVARVRVLDQSRDPDGVLLTVFEFTEFGRDGKPLPPKIFTLRGEEAYFDALVIKFLDDAVKVGDPLRGKSLHLFRRAFGSAQEPRDGPLLAASDGLVPDAYRGPEEPSDFEVALWRQFWRWVAHPREAEAQGVRVAQIEAVGTRPVEGATYLITLRHSGGLDIRRLEGP